jgi:hypothetical protein
MTSPAVAAREDRPPWPVRFLACAPTDTFRSRLWAAVGPVVINPKSVAFFLFAFGWIIILAGIVTAEAAGGGKAWFAVCYNYMFLTLTGMSVLEASGVVAHLVLRGGPRRPILIVSVLGATVVLGCFVIDMVMVINTPLDAPAVAPDLLGFASISMLVAMVAVTMLYALRNGSGRFSMAGQLGSGAGSLTAGGRWRAMRLAARLMPRDVGRRWLAEAESFLAEAPPTLHPGAVRSYLANAPQTITEAWAGYLTGRVRATGGDLPSRRL